MSDDREAHVLSLFLATPTWYDKLHLRSHDYTYIVEYKSPKYLEYGGIDQKRHQRRYGNLVRAMRRFDYLLVTREISKAYILQMPIDVGHYKNLALESHALCTRCGGHEFKFDGKE